MTTTDRDVVHLVGNGVTESRSDGNINYRGTVHFHSKEAVRCHDCPTNSCSVLITLPSSISLRSHRASAV